MNKNNLRKIRIKNKFTQKEIADYLNIAPTTYAGYEQGVRNISNDILIKLSAKYNVTTDYLLGITDIPSSPFEENFLLEVDLSDEELLEKYSFTFEGKEISEEEVKRLFKVIRALEKD